MNPISKFIKYHGNKMLKEFNLSHYELVVVRGNFKHQMEIEIDPEYLEALIRYGRLVEKEWALGWKERIIMSLAHEISHLLTEQVLNAACDNQETKVPRNVIRTNEAVTEHISRLLYRLYRRK